MRALWPAASVLAFMAVLLAVVALAAGVETFILRVTLGFSADETERVRWPMLVTFLAGIVLGYLLAQRPKRAAGTASDDYEPPDQN